MAFLSPLPGAGGGLTFLASPANMLTSPLGLCLSSPAHPKTSPPHFAVKEGRLSLERLLDEAGDSQNSSQEEALDVFSHGRPATLGKANSAKQLDAFATQPAHSRNPSDAASNAMARQEPEGGMLADSDVLAKLQEQLKPWLQQQVQALTGGSLGLQSEGSSMDAKLQAALCQEEIMNRAAEMLPVMARQLQSSQERTLSMEQQGSVCTAKAQQQSPLPSAAAIPVNSSADSDCSGQENHPPNAAAGQQAHQSLLPCITSPAIEVAQQASDHMDVSERPAKRVCISLELPARCSPSAAVPAAPQSYPVPISWNLELPQGPLSEAEAPASGGGEPRKRRTHYVKMRELENSIQEAQVVAQHLKQAVAQAEAQHASMLEENRQLWNAVAHLTASLHAGHAAMLDAAFAAMAPAQSLLPPQEQLLHVGQQLSPGCSSEMTESEAEDPTPAPAAAPASANPGFDAEMFDSSPDPMALAEACGMLFSPAHAKLPRDAAAGAAHAAPANKPRKLFEEEMALCCAGSSTVPAPAEPAVPGLADLPLLQVQ